MTSPEKGNVAAAIEIIQWMTSTCCVILDGDAAIPVQPICAQYYVVDAHVSLVPRVELLVEHQPASA